MVDHATATVVVAAPPAHVLDVIADLAAYPQWAGDVRSAQVRTRGADGRPAEVELRVESGPIRDTQLLAYSWDVDPAGEGTVSWHLLAAESVRALHGSYDLRAAGEGTSVTYTLSVRPTIPLPGFLRRQAERTIIEVALGNLRRRVEGGR